MRKLLSIFITVSLFFSCGGKHNPPPKTYDPPYSTTLSQPLNNQVCTTGTSVSDSQTTISFSWANVSTADSYELHIRNLVSGDSIISSTTKLTYDVKLLKSMPYSWYVVSKSSKVAQKATSATWKFYASGPGITETAPYPPALTSPYWGQEVSADLNGQVTLSWTDNANKKAITYTVYYGSAPPYFPLSVVANGTTATIAVATQSVYYWKVIGTDAGGNTVNSQISTFYVR